MAGGRSDAGPDRLAAHMTAQPARAIRALVTNDDGIAAPGLRHLARAAVAAGMDVVVVAPETEFSGASAGLSAVFRDGRLALTETALDSLPVSAHKAQASPSYLVVLAALGTFGPRPDVVLCGINRGANAGHAIVHSGTVGAAFTAANYGLRAMAVSLDVLTAATADPAADPATGGTTSDAALTDTLATVNDDALHWATAGAMAERLLTHLSELPTDAILNVNVPNLPLDRVAGVRQTSLAPYGQVQMAVAESGRGFVRLTVETGSHPSVAGTDLAALAERYVSVSLIGTMRVIDHKLRI
jgi:5'-nucleotidase